MIEKVQYYKFENLKTKFLFRLADKNSLFFFFFVQDEEEEEEKEEQRYEGAGVDRDLVR